ncbi:MAG TPA: hypothetical protein ENN22_11425 [bacterium]|nr:hypothetical protein [bacterium]
MLTVDPTHCSKLTVALMVQNKNLVLIICDQCFILKTAKQSVKTVSTQGDIFNLIAQQAANSKFQMDKFQINFNYQISMTKTSCKKMQD